MAEPVLSKVSGRARPWYARLSRHLFTEASESTGVGSAKQTTSTRCVRELPGPEGLPILGSFPDFLRKENQGQIHELQLRYHKKYGNMFRFNFGQHTNISLADPRLVEEFMRNEGRHPNRPPYQSWVLYKELRKKENGLMSAGKENWHKYRSAIAPKLLRPKDVSTYADQMNDVIDGLVKRVRHVRDENGLVPNLPNEFYKWAVESIATVVFGCRLGCLENEMPPDMQEFIDSVGIMFLTGYQMVIGASLHKLLKTNIWKKHVSSSDVIYNFAQKIIDQRLNGLSPSENGAEAEKPSDLLAYLLHNKALTIPEIHSNLAELILAGLDTASNTLGFTVYLLAKNPRVQEKLHAEVERVLRGQTCQSSHLAEMPYLRAVLKESMRLYPVIPIGARVTTEDLVLGGYLIPKGTCVMIHNYAMSRDENSFQEADRFIPERWFRSDTRDFHPFSVIPFGHGSRSCIGRRVAELELNLAICRFTQNFWFQMKDNCELNPYLRTVLTVGDELPAEFVDR